LSSPAGISTPRPPATVGADPLQGAIETFLRTDPEMVKRFGATPHDGRLACAFTPIVPPGNDHLALPRPEDDERVRDGVRSRG